MKLYDNLDDLIKQLGEDVGKSLEAVKRDYIDDKMEEAIDETVYAVQFDAENKYKRRGHDDGLIDRDNYSYAVTNVPPVFGDKRTISMRIFNSAMGNSDYRGYYRGFIDWIIATGKGYSWVNSAYYIANEDGKPIQRDFYKATQEKIEGNIGQLLKQELHKKGW